MEEKVRQLMEALHNDPKVRELAKDIKRPETDEEAAAAYSMIAKELGFDFTSDELLNSLKAMEENQRIRTNEADAEFNKATLSESDLEKVSGGVGDPSCGSTYNEHSR